jgi:hypothetical protein
MTKKYHVGLLDHPIEDDPHFPDFQAAFRYCNNEGLTYSGLVYAIWEDDDPVVLFFDSFTFTLNGWVWPSPPKKMVKISAPPGWLSDKDKARFTGGTNE